MISKSNYIKEVVRAARKKGFRVETNLRNGYEQIDFGNKKLHTGHLADLYPEILVEQADIPALIERAAPGRPCTHKPMREIIELLRNEGKC